MLSHGLRDLGDDVAGHALSLSRPALVPTLVRLTSSCAGVPEGDALALAAHVTSVANGPVATGSVVFRVGDRALGSAALDDTGEAVLDGIRLPVGVHAMTATYEGDGTHAAASSAPLPQAVTAAAAPVVLLLSSESTATGAVLQAELVDPATGRVADDATGSVTFLDDSDHLLGEVPLRAGVARVVLPLAPVGRLKAHFFGDTEHAPAFGMTCR